MGRLCAALVALSVVGLVAALLGGRCLIAFACAFAAHLFVILWLTTRLLPPHATTGED